MIYDLNPNILPHVSLVNSVKVEPPYVHRRRKADEYIIYIIKNGMMHLKENEVRYTLVPGDVLVLDPEYVHQGIESSFCEYYYIHFRHESVNKNDADQGSMGEWASIRNKALQSNSFSYDLYKTERLILPKYLHVKNQSSFIKIMYILDGAIEENKTQLENYKINCSCKILEAMIQIERSFISMETESFEKGAVKSYIKVQELLGYMNTDYAKYFSGSIIEKKFRCNFDYINRIFKQTTGSTIFSYLNRVRINQAKVLILTTSLKTAEIGEQVGFSDTYYFSKVFKKHTGVSPTTFGKGILKNRQF